MRRGKGRGGRRWHNEWTKICRHDGALRGLKIEIGLVLDISESAVHLHRNTMGKHHCRLAFGKEKMGQMATRLHS